MVDDPARYHRQIGAEVDRTVRLVDDLFELSRIHAGLPCPPWRRCHSPIWSSELIAGAESLAAGQGVRLGGEIDEGVTGARRPGRTGRVLGNLVMNAIRHTPAEGTVPCSPAGPVASGVGRVEVSDACGGIPADELARVFDVAFRGEAARTPAPGTPAWPATAGSRARAGHRARHRRGPSRPSSKSPTAASPTPRSGCAVRGQPPRITRRGVADESRKPLSRRRRWKEADVPADAAHRVLGADGGSARARRTSRAGLSSAPSPTSAAGPLRRRSLGGVPPKQVWRAVWAALELPDKDR